MNPSIRTLRLLIPLILIAVGCVKSPTQQPSPGVTRSPTDSVTAAPTDPLATPLTEGSPTPFPAPPSPTTVPLALAVNGDPITYAEYEASMARYYAGVEDATPESAHQHVIGDFIDQLLLSQSAGEAGFSVEDEVLDARIGALADELGGLDALTSWWTQNGYTPESFRTELRRAIAAAWMRDQVLATLSDTQEQVRARHILVPGRAEAEEILGQLNNGASFDTLIVIYDPISLGELGWFPRGYLFEPAVEEAAFSLQPGEYSPVVETSLGFHIVQVDDYDPDRALAPDARWVLGNQILGSWLEAQRAESDIEILVP